MARKQSKLRRQRFGNSLSSSLTDNAFVEPAFSPSEGVVNLADAMLVFACGLMVALLTFWNLDIPTASASREVIRQESAQSIDEVDQEITLEDLGSQGYDELGVVYQDPETG
ncbi:MAG: DUF2149 domain-containing protein, partial [Actinobacteria bacterium]|nr:DUF2149 domain-containing protein [Actinomycetota bacterium]